MKKTFVVVFGLFVATTLSACGEKATYDVNDNDSTQTEVNNQYGDVNEVDTNIYTKTSLTLEDLDEINGVLFPRSYTYETYRWEDNYANDSGEFVYPEDIDHDLLLPIHATVADRSVISSSIEDGKLYTIVNADLQDGTMVSILYINDPFTLEYLAASVDSEDGTTLYTFYY